MLELPSGTVTFLFSDIEGSTGLVQRFGDRWGEILAAHNRIMRESFVAVGGKEVDRQGDAFFAVFSSARHAVAAAVNAQRALSEHGWPDGAELRVRMGIHTGEPAVGEEGYLGVDVVRAARICAEARGGEVLVSETTKSLVQRTADGIELRDAGEHLFKGFEQPERLFRLAGEGLPALRATAAAGLAEGGAPFPIPPDPPAPGHAADWERRAEELAEEAMRTVSELGPLDTLGPRIVRQVEDTLKHAGVAPPGREEARLGGPPLTPRARRPRSRPLRLLGVVLLLVAVAVIVYGLVRAL